jgi:Tfp pilus assembly protein PilV
MSTGGRRGFNLLEVVVALVLLQVSLLGVLGLFSLAVRRLNRALQRERAAVEAVAVADSLSGLERVEAGESIRGAWRVTWEPLQGGVLVRADLLAGPGSEPVVELRVP